MKMIFSLSPELITARWAISDIFVMVQRKLNKDLDEK